MCVHCVPVYIKLTPITCVCVCVYAGQILYCRNCPSEGNQSNSLKIPSTTQKTLRYVCILMILKCIIELASRKCNCNVVKREIWLMDTFSVCVWWASVCVFSSGLYTNTHTQPQTLLKHMSSSDADLNAPNEEGDSPIHAIIRRKRKKRADLLLTLLVNGCSRVDLDRCSMVSGETALHLAVMVSECIFLQYACAVSPARN